MDKFDLYQDIATRTGGDIYLGVVGPVRTGKSTFITKFMETLVLPNIADKHRLQRVVDEMPQSADGKTIMTTQPKFVPDDGVKVTMQENLNFNVRLIDCVGYLVDGAVGHREGDKPRLVRTPWDDEEIPFEQAAQIGTDKVIKDHSTIGVVLTTDGSITDIPRSGYIEAEERVVKELEQIGKPFVIVLNSKTPLAEETQKLTQSLSEKYGVTAIAKDVQNMNSDDITDVMSGVLMEFPIRLIQASMPKWLQCLSGSSELIKKMTSQVASVVADVNKMSDYKKLENLFVDDENLEKVSKINVEFGKGSIEFEIVPKPHLFYKVLSEECGIDLSDDFKLISFVKSSRYAATEYGKLKEALMQVEAAGYGVVVPAIEDMELEEPEIMKQGGKFGVKIKASAPSLHIMRVDVSTEVSPIVGTQAQSEEMAAYLMEQYQKDKDGIWATNMFGKTLDTLVKEGINGKLATVQGDTQDKLRKTITRIVNEGKGGVLCVLI